MNSPTFAYLRDCVRELRVEALKRSARATDSWGSAFANGEWGAAVLQLEQLLDKEPDGVELRLWWIQAQLLQGKTPAAALAASLESIYSSSLSDTSLGLLVELTSLTLGLYLAEKDQIRLALIQLERCEARLSSGSELLSEKARGALGLFVSELLQTELAKAEKRREKAVVLKALEGKIEKRRADTSRFQRLFEAQESASPLETMSSPWRVDGALPKNEDDRRSPSRLLPLVGGFVVVTVGALLLRSSLAHSTLFAAPLGELAMNSAVRVKGAQQVSLLPELSPRLGARVEDESMTELTRRLETLSRRPPESAVVAPPVVPDTPAAAPPPREPAPAVESKGGPHYYDPKPRPDKTPELDTSKIAQNVVESLDNVRVTMEREGVRVGRDGRPYGRGPETDAREDLDGAPLRGYEVQQFEKPILYKTIAATNVLSAPSVLASAVARLDSDATIQVVSRMGKWLEIESRGGRRGYIYSQNAIALK